MERTQNKLKYLEIQELLQKPEYLTGNMVRTWKPYVFSLDAFLQEELTRTLIAKLADLWRENSNEFTVFALALRSMVEPEKILSVPSDVYLQGSIKALVGFNSRLTGECKTQRSYTKSSSGIDTHDVIEQLKKAPVAMYAQLLDTIMEQADEQCYLAANFLITKSAQSLVADRSSDSVSYKTFSHLIGNVQSRHRNSVSQEASMASALFALGDLGVKVGSISLTSQGKEVMKNNEAVAIVNCLSERSALGLKEIQSLLNHPSKKSPKNRLPLPTLREWVTRLASEKIIYFDGPIIKLTQSGQFQASSLKISTLDATIKKQPGYQPKNSMQDFPQIDLKKPLNDDLRSLVEFQNLDNIQKTRTLVDKVLKKEFDQTAQPARRAGIQSDIKHHSRKKVYA